MLVEQFLLNKGVAEGVVVLVAHLGEVVGVAVGGFTDFKLVDNLLELGWNHELDIVALQLFEEVEHERNEELLE